MFNPMQMVRNQPYVAPSVVGQIARATASAISNFNGAGGSFRNVGRGVRRLVTGKQFRLVGGFPKSTVAGHRKIATSKRIVRKHKTFKKKARLAPKTKALVKRIAQGEIKKDHKKGKTHGNFTYIANRVFDVNNQKNKQLVWTNNSKVSFAYFTPASVAHAAAVMYNGKLATETGIDIIGGKIGNFDDDVKIQVVSGSVKEVFTNNTTGVMDIIHFRCHPKMDATGVTQTPEALWDQAILMKEVQLAGVFATNTKEFWGDEPTRYPLFNEMYNVDRKFKRLGPGQSFTNFYKKGSQLYDFSELSQISTATQYDTNVKGKTVWSMFIVRPHVSNFTVVPVRGDPALHQMHNATLTQKSGSIIHEMTIKMNIEAPDEVATTLKHEIEHREHWNETFANTVSNIQAQKPVPALVSLD